MENDSFPQGWGEDLLSDFQHKAFANELWSFANDSEFTKLLSQCDSLIFETLRKVFPESTVEANLGSLLFVNSHNHFRAAARLCLSGQCLPVYPTARASLETALYGWFLITHPDKVEEWLNKPEAKGKPRTEWNNTFMFSKIAERIGELDPDSEQTLNELHQISIDFGAHPNRKSLASNLSQHTDNKTLHRVAYMHSGGHLFEYTFNFMFNIALSILVLIKLAHKTLDNDEDFANKAKALRSIVLTQRSLFDMKLMLGL